MNKAVLVCVFISIFYSSVHCDDASEQMEKATQVVRQVCQPKFKVPDELFQTAMNSGQIPDDKNFKCFLHCSLEMMGMMKRNKVLFDAAKKQMETLLPDDVKGDWINALNICEKKVEIVKNTCDTAYNIMICFKDNNPKFKI